MQKLKYYLPRVIAALIMLQTLYFKFGLGGPEALEESKNLFGGVTSFLLGSSDLEWLVRIGTGIGELLASILLFVPRFTKWGALLTIGVMSGAVVSHLLILGIAVADDDGFLFGMAVVALVCGVLAYLVPNTQVAYPVGSDR
ncbi:MAG: DoxX family protein [Cytophagales bacterium]|nr:DoxX family protein [Cytophagales bacterium]